MQTYAIHGMTCEHCVRAVERAQAAIEGAPQEAAVITAVHDEGYEARRT